jgi:hypothetical protein
MTHILTSYMMNPTVPNHSSQPIITYDAKELNHDQPVKSQAPMLLAQTVTGFIFSQLSAIIHRFDIAIY